MRSKHEQIRQLFADIGGGVPVRYFAPEVIKAGIFTSDELSLRNLRYVQAVCRAALAEENPATGLPWAQPLAADFEDDDGSKLPAWKQLEFFTKDEFFELVTRRSTALHFDYRALVRLHAHCVERFGEAPEIPSFGEAIE